MDVITVNRHPAPPAEEKVVQNKSNSQACAVVFDSVYSRHENEHGDHKSDADVYENLHRSSSSCFPD